MALTFDERVHLAIVGGGFIRTPFLSLTKDRPAYQEGECFPSGPSIVHVPAAGRRSGLSQAIPAFRRAVFASTLVQTLSREEAAQINQESAGIAFQFSPYPHRNVCRAHLSDATLLRGERTLVLDTPVTADSPIQFNDLPAADAPTGWLVWVSRFWDAQRHLDREILTKYHIPLHYDLDFTVAYVPTNQAFAAILPIYGGKQRPFLYDPSFGPRTRNENKPESAESDEEKKGGSNHKWVTLFSGGQARIIADNLGGWLMEVKDVPSAAENVSIVITDGDETYCRDITIKDVYPTHPVVSLPTGMIDGQYKATIPPSTPFFDVISYTLPMGLSYTPEIGVISGVPTEYGTNFSIVVEITEPTGVKTQVRYVLTISRPQRELMSILDCETNDRSTGEYYGLVYVPYGSCIEYGGSVYEFRRFKSLGEPWPAVVQVPYSYMVAGRQAAVQTENAWAEILTNPTPPVPPEPVTKYVVGIVLDGVRYTETAGTPVNIPNIRSIFTNGTTFDNLRSNTPATVTIQGHAALMTGANQALANDGTQHPDRASYMAEFLRQKGLTSGPGRYSDRVKYVSSKDKLFCLNQVTRLDPEEANPWVDYIPFFDSGVNGSGGGGYRDDALTLQVFKDECLSASPPNLSFVTFASPDTKAHAQDWAGYINAIQTIDGYVAQIWALIQAHPLMAGRTCMFVTTDHGRSTPDWWNHGGGSESERHLPGWIIGPIIKDAEYHSPVTVDLTGFAPTIMHMLGMTKTEGTGTVMTDILKV